MAHSMLNIVLSLHNCLCQIRDGVAGQTMPGVTINDMGHRMGLNGVDNALLSFDNVKVPRTNLLKFKT